MATVQKLVQGSQAWLDYRRTMRNASETPVVLGLSPWLTPYGLWLIKTGRTTQPVTEAMSHGTATEPLARAAYEAQTGLVMNPLVLQDDVYSASLDGITLAGDLVLEIKCPFRGKQSTLWKEVANGVVPAHYQAQVQHQLMVANAQEAHLWVYAEGEGLLVSIRRDNDAIDSIKAGWETFQPYLDSDTPLPLTEADSVLRDDPEWEQAAKAFAQAKQAVDQADEGLEAARRALLDLVKNPRETGAGISVVKLWKTGNVDYKRIPELTGVDLERYRGKGREEVRVTVVK